MEYGSQILVRASSSTSSRRSSRALVLVLPFLLAACDMQPVDKSRDALWQAEVDAVALALHADAAAEGNLDAFDELRATRQSIDAALNAAGPGSTPPGLAAAWGKARGLADAVLSGQAAVLALAEAEAEFGAMTPRIVAGLDEIQRLVAESEEARATPQQVYVLTRNMLLLDRMQRRAERIRRGGSDALSAADAFARDRAILERTLAALQEGAAELDIQALTHPEALKLLGEVRAQVPAAMEAAQPFFDQVTPMLEAHEAASELPFAVADLRAQLQRLRTSR